MYTFVQILVACRGKKYILMLFSTVTFCSCYMFPLTLWILYQLIKRFNASLFEGKLEECSYNHLLAVAVCAMAPELVISRM